MGLFGIGNKKKVDMHIKKNETVEKIKDYLSIIKTDETIEVCFYVDTDEIMSIGQKIKEINNQAYMNGYNWEIFFEYYLKQKSTNILEGMKCNVEASLYVAYYNSTSENEVKVKKLIEIISSLIENEEYVYEFIREHSDIEWD